VGNFTYIVFNALIKASGLEGNARLVMLELCILTVLMPSLYVYYTLGKMDIPNCFKCDIDFVYYSNYTVNPRYKKPPRGRPRVSYIKGFLLLRYIQKN